MPAHRTFLHLLVNTLIVSVINVFYVLLLAIGVVALALVHLGFVSVDDRPPAVDRAEPVEVEAGKNEIDLRGTCGLSAACRACWR